MSVKRDDTSPGVLRHLEDGVLTITLNRPERRNAVDEPTAELLTEAVLAAHADRGCRVIVIKGAGPAFCAGWDVKALASLRGRTPADIEAAFERNRVLLDSLRDAPQATVACVHGAVMGFGLGLVASCDLAVAAESTTVSLPEIGLGVVPALVMLDVLDVAPEKIALDWLLTGDRRTATHGLEAGLFSRVVEDTELETEVSALAARLAAHDPEVLTATKRLYRRLEGVDREAAVRIAVATSAATLSE